MNLFKKLFSRFKKSIGKSKPDIQKLFASDNINDSIIEIDHYISEFCSYGDEMENLNDIQKQFYYNHNLERGVNNGGFSLYFSNSSGDFAQQKLESLIAIGANTTEDILQKAIDQFPNHIVLADLNQRLETIAQIVKKVDPIWEKIDNDFYGIRFKTCGENNLK
ncbi:MAG: DUF4375 domain-containing protein [bacterium]|nr:DUF4375 domain-containing protein [bacterium]